MSRIPSHTVEDAPEASRALLQEIIQFSPTGRPLNMHAQMAHSPAVLEVFTAYFLDYAGTELDLPART